MLERRTTSNYLKLLESSFYGRHGELCDLHDAWKENADIGSLKRFLDITWQDRDKITMDHFSNSVYRQFRHTVFREFCSTLLHNTIRKNGSDNVAEIFLDEQIHVKSSYLFEDGIFKEHPSYVPVDIAVGVRDGSRIYPRVIVDCCIWLTFNQLGNTQADFDIIKNTYPMLTGFALTTAMSGEMDARQLSVIDQKTGVKIYNIFYKTELDEFSEEIKKALYAGV